MIDYSNFSYEYVDNDIWRGKQFKNINDKLLEELYRDYGLPICIFNSHAGFEYIWCQGRNRQFFFIRKFLTTDNSNNKSDRCYEWPYVCLDLGNVNLQDTKLYLRYLFGHKTDLGLKDILSSVNSKTVDWETLVYPQQPDDLISNEIATQNKNLAITAIIGLIKTSADYHDNGRNGKIVIKIGNDDIEYYKGVLKDILLLIPSNYRYRVSFTFIPSIENDEFHYRPNKFFNIIMVPNTFKKCDVNGVCIIQSGESGLSDEDSKKYEWLYEWAELSEEERNKICNMYCDFSRYSFERGNIASFFNIIEAGFLLYKTITRLPENMQSRVMELYKDICGLKEKQKSSSKIYKEKRSIKDRKISEIGVENLQNELRLLAKAKDQLMNITSLDSPCDLDLSNSSALGRIINTCIYQQELQDFLAARQAYKPPKTNISFLHPSIGHLKKMLPTAKAKIETYFEEKQAECEATISSKKQAVDGINKEWKEFSDKVREYASKLNENIDTKSRELFNALKDYPDLLLILETVLGIDFSKYSLVSPEPLMSTSRGSQRPKL